MHDNRTSPYLTEVGIDVSKATLRVHRGGAQEDWENTPASIRKLLAALAKGGGSFRITCEATGSYDTALILACLEKGVPVSQANPAHVKSFIRSFGRHAKTDAIDARYIALFARERNPATLGDEWLGNHRLRESHRRLRALVEMRSAQLASVDKYRDKAIVREIRAVVAYLEKRIAKYEAALLKAVETDRSLAAKREVMEKVAGVGTKTCLSLLIEVPELGTLNRRDIAGLVGLAPQHCESGTYKGSRRLRGGRKRPRSALYMAALTACRCNRELAAFYKRMREAGKPAKVAIIAVARKLLVYLNTQLKPLCEKT
jgi:transposase